jgi:hypothetical protein
MLSSTPSVSVTPSKVPEQEREAERGSKALSMLSSTPSVSVTVSKMPE